MDVNANHPPQPMDAEVNHNPHPLDEEVNHTPQPFDVDANHHHHPPQFAGGSHRPPPPQRATIACQRIKDSVPATIENKRSSGRVTANPLPMQRQRLRLYQCRIMKKNQVRESGAITLAHPKLSHRTPPLDADVNSHTLVIGVDVIYLRAWGLGFRVSGLGFRVAFPFLIHRSQRSTQACATARLPLLHTPSNFFTPLRWLGDARRQQAMDSNSSDARPRHALVSDSSASRNAGLFFRLRGHCGTPPSRRFASSAVALELQRGAILPASAS